MESLFAQCVEKNILQIEKSAFAALVRLIHSFEHVDSCLLLVLVCLSRTTIHNKHRLEDLMNSQPSQPLFTVSNHYSCFNDPSIWECLKLKNVFSTRKNRWSAAAICFTIIHSMFIMFGKCIPVVRGEYKLSENKLCN